MDRWPEWMSPKTTAQYQDTSVRVVRDQLKMGLPHVRLNRKNIKINRADLDAWLRGHDSTGSEVDAIVRDMMRTIDGRG